MATSSLTLAALATSAVPNLVALGVRKHSLGGAGECESVVVQTDGADVLVQLPNDDVADSKLAADVLGRTALTAGVRNKLHFEVAETLGVTRFGDSRAFVSTYLHGSHFDIADLNSESILLASIAGVLESLHALPAKLVSDAGLPVSSAEACRVSCARLVDRANKTGLLPGLVHNRWLKSLQDKYLWDFVPAVTHNSLDTDALLIVDDSVSGVLNFGALAVADPAADFVWLCAAPEGVLEAVVARYSERTDIAKELLLRRTWFLHELELAKWLLHGVDTKNQEIIDDAVNLLDGLVDAPRPSANAASVPLSEHEVSELLDQTPDVDLDSLPHFDTESYEVLDEGRTFLANPETSSPLTAADIDAVAAAAAEANADADTDAAADANATAAVPTDTGADTDADTVGAKADSAAGATAAEPDNSGDATASR